MMFFRLLPLPDDHGCFDARVKVLRGKLFPFMYEKVRDGDIEKWLKELQSVDCIRTWVHANGFVYGLFPNWSEHQVIRSLHKRKTPSPPDEVLASSCMQVNADECLNPNPNLNPNLNPNPKTHSAKFCEFSTAWAEYPEKIGRKAAERHYKSTVPDQETHDRLMKAMRRYVEHVNAKNARRNGNPLEWQNGSTWFNNWQEWQDYKDAPLPETPEDKRLREIQEMSDKIEERKETDVNA